MNSIQANENNEKRNIEFESKKSKEKYQKLKIKYYITECHAYINCELKMDYVHADVYNIFRNIFVYEMSIYTFGIFFR